MASPYKSPYKSTYSSPYANPYSISTDPIASKISRLESAGIDASLTPKKSVLETLLDLLSRPEAASASLVGGLMKGEDVGTIASNIGQSLTGKKKLTYTDLLKEAGLKDNFGTKALGFVLGTALDPTTYIPVGAVAKFGRKIPGLKTVMKYGDDAIKAAKNAVGLKTLTGAAKEADTILKGASGGVNYTAEQVFKKYEPLLDSLKSTGDEQLNLVRKALDLQKTVQPKLGARNTDKILAKYLSKMDESGLNLYRTASGMFAETGATKKASGIIDELIEGYLPHITTKEFRDKAIELGRSPEEMVNVLKGLTRKGIAKKEKSRSLLDNIDYLNKLARKKYNLGEGVNMFESDIKKIIPTYLHNYAKNTSLLETNKELLGLIDEAGKPLFKKLTKENADKGMVKLSGLAFNGYQTTPEIAKMVNRVNGVLTSDVTLNKFLKAFDKTQSAWKKLVTVVNPSFHINNLIGATFNNFVEDAGSLAPDVLSKAEKLLSFDGKNASKVILTAKNGAKITGDAFIDYLKKHGALTTFISPEKMVKKGSVGAKVIDKLGGGVERLARTQLAISQFKKTGKMSNVVEAVWKVHGNYAPEALSTFEREGVKRVLPFYVWAKTNIPFQIKSLINKTGKYAQLARVENQMVTPEQRAELPEWQRGKVLLPIKDLGDNKKRVQSLNLPVGDLNDLTNPLQKLLFGRMSPLVKGPIEMAFNKNIFYDKPIVDKDLPSNMQKAPAPDAVKFLPEPLKKIIGYRENKEINEASGEEKTSREMNARLAYLLNTYGGQVSKYGNLPKTSENLGMEPSNINTILGALAGVITPFSPKVYDTREQAYSNEKQQAAELQARINYLIQRGLIPRLK